MIGARLLWSLCSTNRNNICRRHEANKLGLLLQTSKKSKLTEEKNEEVNSAIFIFAKKSHFDFLQSSYCQLGSQKVQNLATNFQMGLT